MGLFLLGVLGAAFAFAAAAHEAIHDHRGGGRLTRHGKVQIGILFGAGLISIVATGLQSRREAVAATENLVLRRELTGHRYPLTDSVLTEIAFTTDTASAITRRIAAGIDETVTQAVDLARRIVRRDSGNTNRELSAVGIRGWRDPNASEHDSSREMFTIGDTDLFVRLVPGAGLRAPTTEVDSIYWSAPYDVVWELLPLWITLEFGMPIGDENRFTVDRHYRLNTEPRTDLTPGAYATTYHITYAPSSGYMVLRVFGVSNAPLRAFSRSTGAIQTVLDLPAATLTVDHSSEEPLRAQWLLMRIGGRLITLDSTRFIHHDGWFEYEFTVDDIEQVPGELEYLFGSSD